VGENRIGPIMRFFGFRKTGKTPVDPAAEGKGRQLEAMISVATSIQDYSSNSQARRFLTARHGRGVRIAALTLYYEVDTLWVGALKLARELGDRKSELEILFRFGRLQHEPPSRSILFPGPVSPEELVDLVQAESKRDSEKNGAEDPPPQGPIPELAIGFYREAMPLAVELGDTVKEIALGFFMTRALRELGKYEEATRTREDLRSSFDRASARAVVIPDWLRREAGRETFDLG
jgi:hypothetical protein